MAIFHPPSPGGRYAIDYERFEQLKNSLTGAEIKEARQLLKRVELVNTRKDTLTRILQAVIERQALYLESGDLKALLPFSQKELARKIGLAPSSVSRAIRDKSIDTPWGKEVPLKHFFPRPKSFRKELLRQLLESQGGACLRRGNQDKITGEVRRCHLPALGSQPEEGTKNLTA